METRTGEAGGGGTRINLPPTGFAARSGPNVGQLHGGKEGGQEVSPDSNQ
ncbi:hypothetical protein TNCV_2832651, partial [Trichonephila clavipes]